MRRTNQVARTPSTTGSQAGFARVPRTRITRITAASALVLALGAAVTAGPAAAGEQPRVGSSPIGMTSGASIDTRTASPNRVGASSVCGGCWAYVGKHGSLASCRSAGQSRLNAGYADYMDYQCSMVPNNGRYDYWLFMQRR